MRRRNDCGSRDTPTGTARNKSPKSSTGWQTAGSFREQERQLGLELIVRRAIGAEVIVVGSQREIDRLLANVENPAKAAAHRYKPGVVVALRLPVGGDDRCRRKIPALLEVVVQEGLKDELVDVFPVTVARE